MDILTSIVMAMAPSSRSSPGTPPLISYLILGAILGLIPAYIAWKKGRSFLVWYIFGIICWIVAAIIAIFLKKDQKRLDERMLKKGFRKCPACSEIIKEEALLCKHCNTDIMKFVHDAREAKTNAQVKLFDKNQVQSTAVSDSYNRTFGIGKEYGLDVEKIRCVDKKLAIKEAIVNYDRDDASKELISNALKVAKDVSLAKKISPSAKRSSILRAIAFVQARSGNIDHALEIAQEIKDKDDFSRALIEIAFKQKDNLGEAIKTLKQMPKQRLLYEQLRDISLAQALLGNFEESIETAKNIPQGEGTRAILDIIKTAKSMTGDLQKDTETAQKKGDIDTLIDIAMKHALSGDITQATVIAQKLPNPNVSSNLLRVFAMGYVWLGDEQKAMQIAQRISVEPFRSAILGEIATSFSELSDDAINMTRQISDKTLGFMFLTDIVMKQLFSGNVEKSIKVIQEILDENIHSKLLEVIAESIDALIQAQA